MYEPLDFGPIPGKGSTTNRRFVRPPDPARRTAGPDKVNWLPAGPTGRLRDDDQGSLVVCQRFWYNAHSKATGGVGVGCSLSPRWQRHEKQAAVRRLFAVVLPEWRKGGTGGVEKKGTDCPCHEERY